MHDRFMLPHYAFEDLREVAGDLQRAGFPFQMEWLAPFFEFRFPVYGTAKIENIELELRFAIEPWHVLGEEMSNTGTARFVDSSVERLQVKVSGFTFGRYIITCNGRRLPLRATGRKGEYVAGVRYRAWQPPSALHPTIAPHTPIVIDVFDSWNGRSIGGCTYHVSHPGGRSYDTFPVNSFEAEARRITRFWDYGHSPANIEDIPPVLQYGKGNKVTGVTFTSHNNVRPATTPALELPDEEYPYTLDLRYDKKL